MDNLKSNKSKGQWNQEGCAAPKASHPKALFVLASARPVFHSRGAAAKLLLVKQNMAAKFARRKQWLRA